MTARRPAPPYRVTHLITSLSVGGAQAMLCKLLSRQDRHAFTPQVISMVPLGPLADDLRAMGVPVSSLELRRGLPELSGLARLIAHLKADRPHLLQTWMYHADLLGGLVGRLMGIPVVWNIRHSDLPPDGSKRLTRLTAAACARLSRPVPRAIICCSEATRRVHAALGYDASKLTVVPNGFDLERFAPDPQAYHGLRLELALPPEAFLIGMVARVDPQKDHATFLRAAARLSARVPEAHFLLCGDDATWETSALTAPIQAAGLSSRFRLLGRRGDMPRVTAALDLAVLSSAYGEGFPNVVGEAMAAGVPCLATDVGDAAAMLGDTGTLVPPSDAAALSDAMAEWAALPASVRRQRGQQARTRARDLYDLSAVVRQYEALHRDVNPSLVTSRGQTPVVFSRRRPAFILDEVPSRPACPPWRQGPSTPPSGRTGRARRCRSS